MLLKNIVRCFVVLFTLTLIGTHSAHACMGISRTINIHSFKAHLGTGGSGGIGLRPKEVVLTFDDGPVSATTPRVLAALQRECLKATFFVVGHMARNNPKLLQRIARKGHTIGHHTNTHPNLTHLSLSSAHRNIEAGFRAVNSALGRYRGRSSKLFRYPYLARSAALDSILKRQKLLPLSAGVMSQDWKSGTSSQMVNRVMNRLNRVGRGVILLHDIQPKTASALPLLLKRLKRGGYRVVHIQTGRSSRGPLISRNNRSRNRQVVALKKKASGRPTRKRWSFFRRNTDEVDNTTTGSIRKKSKLKKSRITKSKSRSSRSSRKSKAAKKPSGLIAYLKQRRLKNAEFAKRSKKSKLKAKKKRSTKSKKRSSKRRNSKIAKTANAKRKSLFSFRKSKKALRSGSRNRKKLKKTRKKTKKTAKRNRKKKSSKKTRRPFFARNLIRRKKGESDASYHARLRARRIRLNKS